MPNRYLAGNMSIDSIARAAAAPWISSPITHPKYRSMRFRSSGFLARETIEACMPIVKGFRRNSPSKICPTSPGGMPSSETTRSFHWSASAVVSTRASVARPQRAASIIAIEVFLDDVGARRSAFCFACSVSIASVW